MSKSWRLALTVLLMYGAVTVAHLWLNVGVGQLKIFAGGTAQASYRVGYLPVT